MKKFASSKNRKNGYIRFIGLTAFVLTAAIFINALPNLKAQAESNGSFFGLADLFTWNAPAPAATETIAADEPDAPEVLGTCDTAGPVEVEATAGTVGPTAYATLTAAFAAINAGTHQGVVNVEVCGNTTETATAVLNAGDVAPAVYTSVAVRPVGAPRIITGSIVGAVIRLNGADNVTIDGRIGGTGRNLIVTNSNTAAATAAVWVSSLGVGLGATNNVIRNLELAAGATQNTGTNSTFGIIMSGTTISTSSPGQDNDNNQFLFNRIIRVRYGITTRGDSATNLNQTTVINDNIIGPTAFGADEIGKVGIFAQFENGCQINRNEVQFVGGDFANTTGGADRIGIGLGGESWGSAPTNTTNTGFVVTKNIIHDVIEERTFSAVGIASSTTNGANPTNNLIANNFIANIRANGTLGDASVGLGISGGDGDNVVFNSVRMEGDLDPGSAAATTQTSVNLRIANTPTNLTVRNNSLYNNVFSSSTPALLSANIQVPSATFAFGTGSLNNNNYYFPPANTTARTGAIGTTSLATTFFTTLANWQAALTPPQDAASIQADPLYTSAIDLHILSGSPNINAGVAAGGVTDDIDNETRDATPDIGADEFIIQPGAGEFRFSSATYAGNEGATVAVTVQRINGGTGTVSVNVTIANGTATGGAACTAGVDFINPGTQTLTFVNGDASETFNIQLCSDTVNPKASETVALALANATGGAVIVAPSTATLTINNNPPATLQFSAATANVTEGTATVSLTVTRTNDTTTAVTVNYTFANGTATGGADCATPGVDFINTPGTLTFIAGDTSETIVVTICNDAILESAETFSVTLSNPSANAVLGTTTTNTVTINDNEPRLTFSAATFTGTEAAPMTATLTVTRTGDSTGVVMVDFATSSGTATGGAACGAGVDFVNQSGTLTFAAADTSETITVMICDDAVFDLAEVFFVTLSNPQPAASTGLGAITTANVTITDNEVPPNDTCAGVQALTFNQPIFGTLSGATNNYTLDTTTTTCFSGPGQTATTAPGRDRVYSFTPATTGQFTVRTRYSNTGGNLVTYLTDSCPMANPAAIACGSATTFAANRNTSTTGAEEVLSCVSLTAATTYFIFIDELTAATGGGTYELEVTACPTQEPAAANDTPATAVSFSGTNRLFNGSITPLADVDFFSLGSPAAGSRLFAMTETSGASNATGFSGDTELRATNTTDTLERDDDDGDTESGLLAQSSIITGLPLTGGSRFLRVNEFNNDAQISNYNLIYSIRAPGTETPEAEPNDTIATANNSSPSNYYSGNLSSAADADFFRVSAEPGTLLFIAADGNPARTAATAVDLNLQLYDANGVLLLDINGGASEFSATSGAGSLTATSPTSSGEAFTFRVPVSTIPQFGAPIDLFVRVGGAAPGSYLLQSSIIQLAPTAATATIGGRVSIGRGNGIRNVAVTLTGGGLLEPIIVNTGVNGRYEFPGVPVGQTYFVQVSARRYSFVEPSRLIGLTEDLTDVNFVGEPIGLRGGGSILEQ